MSGNVWFFSDPHLGHTNCIVHDNRPFWRAGEHNNPRWPEGRVPDIVAHDQAVLRLVNDTVHDGDEVWCLGDWVFHGGTPLSLRKTAGWYLDQLGCKINMVAGNHDDQGGFSASRFKHKFASYQDLAYITRKGVKLFLFHYSCRTWRGSNHGTIHLHGHSHGALPGLGRSMDVGLFNNGFRLLELDEIVERMKLLHPIDHHARENAGTD